MLKIENDAGLQPDLPADLTITVDKINSLLSETKGFSQDMGYPATAPFSEINDKFFNHANLVESANGDYNFPANCECDEIPISVGNINFAIRPEGYEFNLEPNYAAKNALVKNVRLPEIFTSDMDRTLANSDAMAARMLDSVKFPDKYPYVFCPVYNPGMGTTHGTGYQFENFFDPATQSFPMAAPGDHGVSANLPFYKLAYVLKQVLQYLGYTVAGSFFTDPETRNVVIHTRLATGTVRGGAWVILPSMVYMPNITLPDFLDFLQGRIHLAIDMDDATGVATVESLGSILRSTEVIDLTRYVSTGVEQEVPPGKGYTVTLKSDEQDAAFKVVNGDDESYPPLFKLIAGDGTEAVELDISTLKGVDLGFPDIGIVGAKYVSTDQRLVGVQPGAFYPEDLEITDHADPSTVNNWPLRLFKYVGWTALTGGGFFPCSEPYDLNEDDKLFYRFMNDSKRLIIPVDMPPSVLARLNVTKKYCFMTAGRNYTEIILEKISYDVKPDSDIIHGVIYARTLNFDINTKVQIQPVVSFINNDNYTAAVKAYFDNSINGFNELDIEVVASGITTQLNPIGIPTNVKGAGGQIAPLLVSDQSFRLIIRQGNPKFIESFGVKTDFTWSAADNYWYVDPEPFRASQAIPTYWISF